MFMSEYWLLAALWARWTLAAVMAVAAVGKLLDQRHFIDTVLDYRILPTLVAQLFARVVPGLELGAAILLVVDSQMAWGVMLSGLMLMIFTLAAIINMARGNNVVQCGCVGKLIHERLGWPLLVRNGCLFVMLWFIATTPSSHSPTSPLILMLRRNDIASFASFAMLVVTATAGFLFFSTGVDFLKRSFSQRQ